MTYSTSTVYIGNVALGGKNPVRIQSMTNTNTLDTAATVNQAKKLAFAGCDFVRITTQNIVEAENLINIKAELIKQGVDIPLIADVHYNPKVAEVAAKIVEKVRINPGNYINNNKLYSGATTFNDIDEYNEMEQNLVPLLKICEQYGTAIRIGVNHGSLSNRILYKYGNTALGMVESIMEFVSICHQNKFNNLVLSLKASNVVVMIEANLLLVKKMAEKGYSYPIHLGVTEAGSEEEGRIKSAAGIGYLLAHGIGDTIRVSLTENPIAEIPFAIQLVEYYEKKGNNNLELRKEIHQIHKSLFTVSPPFVVTSEISKISDLSTIDTKLNFLKQGDELVSIYKLYFPAIPHNQLIIRATVDACRLLIDYNIDGIWIDNKGATSADNLAKLALAILQVMGLRVTKTEFTACPTCGRSSINVISHLKNVKELVSHLPGLKIAIMGCAVNGPGEMADAHYGWVGSGKGKVNIYKGKSIIHKNVKQELATDLLIELIKENGDWINKS